MYSPTSKEWRLVHTQRLFTDGECRARKEVNGHFTRADGWIRIRRKTKTAVDQPMVRDKWSYKVYLRWDGGAREATRLALQGRSGKGKATTPDNGQLRDRFFPISNKNKYGSRDRNKAITSLTFATSDLLCQIGNANRIEMNEIYKDVGWIGAFRNVSSLLRRKHGTLLG